MQLFIHNKYVPLKINTYRALLNACQALGINYRILRIIAHDVLYAHPLLRSKVMWKGIYICTVEPP